MTIYTPSVCACLSCKQMCKTSPCIGYPQDILKLIDAGFKDKLLVTVWVDFEWNGLWPVIAPIATPQGCNFLDTEGLCQLHDLDLKPAEGKLAHHNNKDTNKLRRSVCYSWVNEIGFKTLQLFGATDFELDRLTVLRTAFKR